MQVTGFLGAKATLKITHASQIVSERPKSSMSNIAFLTQRKFNV